MPALRPAKGGQPLVDSWPTAAVFRKASGQNERKLFRSTLLSVYGHDSCLSVSLRISSHATGGLGPPPIARSEAGSLPTRHAASTRRGENAPLSCGTPAISLASMRSYHLAPLPSGAAHYRTAVGRTPVGRRPTRLWRVQRYPASPPNCEVPFPGRPLEDLLTGLRTLQSPSGFPRKALLPER